jgi:glucose 1-dehydrogenase
VYGQQLGEPVELNGHRDLGRMPAQASPIPLALPEDLQGQRAVVTGAARGIGEAIAKWLIMAGADVIVVDKDDQALERSFSSEPCRLLRGDLGHDDVIELVEELTVDGPLELVVNNVGVTARQGVLDIGPSELDRVLVTNLRGPWLFTERLVKALIADQERTPRQRPRRRGSILFISSLHDRFVAEDAHYGVSKAGVAMLVKTMAKQLAAYRIRVNAISPGWIRTAEDITTPGAGGEVRAPATPDPARSGRRARRHRTSGAFPAQRRLVGLYHRPENRRRRRALAPQLAGRVAALEAPAPAGPPPRTRAASDWRARRRPRPPSSIRAPHGGIGASTPPRRSRYSARVLHQRTHRWPEGRRLRDRAGARLLTLLEAWGSSLSWPVPGGRHARRDQLRVRASSRLALRSPTSLPFS